MAENTPAVGEILAALRPFAFLQYPHLFSSTDGGCSAPIVSDEDVQRARDIIARCLPKDSHDG